MSKKILINESQLKEILTTFVNEQLSSTKKSLGSGLKRTPVPAMSPFYDSNGKLFTGPVNRPKDAIDASILFPKIKDVSVLPDNIGKDAINLYKTKKILPNFEKYPFPESFFKEPEGYEKTQYKNVAGYVSEKDTDVRVITSGQKIIGLGSKGVLVKSLQSKLVEHLPTMSEKIGGVGCSKENWMNCDGIFGKNTQNAVIMLQKKFNIPGKKNGVVGKTTWSVLFK